MFFDCSGPVDGVRRDWGHVGLALGDGRIVHAWGDVRIDAIDEMSRLPAAGGWTLPACVGWAPPERILLDARRR